MKTLLTPKGPFPKRPYYTNDDIEQICSDALAETGLLPSEPGKVRIDRFIDKRFKVPIIFELLPAKVLGFTEFGPNGVEAIHIAEPAGYIAQAEHRRINSTLAHEAGHGLMHAPLFALGLDHGNLFGSDPDVTQRRILCRDECDVPVKVQRKYDGRWWEFQANRAIGALLMPKRVFLEFMQPFLEHLGSVGIPSLPDDRRGEAVRAAAETFDVNPAAARVRIDSLFRPTSDQLTL